MAGTVKTPDELVDVYTEWINTYPRCVMLIDPFRYAVRFKMFLNILFRKKKHMFRINYHYLVYVIEYPIGAI